MPAHTTAIDDEVLLRSLLFMPGDNARAHHKATTLPTDGIILDLEDAVASSGKAAARQQVAESLQQLSFDGKQVFIRLNHPLSDEGRHDIAWLQTLPLRTIRLSGIVVPKVESASDIAELGTWMDTEGWSHHIALLANIETPVGILHLPQIATAHPRLSAFLAGKNDLCAALRLPDDAERTGLRYALSHIILVARAYGLLAFDGVYNRLNDPAGLVAECQQGRLLGFDGKTLIHPSQLAITNRIYSPSKDEVLHAQQVISHWEQQEKGVSSASGVMIEELHVRDALRILRLHKLAINHHENDYHTHK